MPELEVGGDSDSERKESESDLGALLSAGLGRRRQQAYDSDDDDDDSWESPVVSSAAPSSSVAMAPKEPSGLQAEFPAYDGEGSKVYSGSFGEVEQQLLNDPLLSEVAKRSKSGPEVFLRMVGWGTLAGIQAAEAVSPIGISGGDPGDTGASSSSSDAYAIPDVEVKIGLTGGNLILQLDSNYVSYFKVAVSLSGGKISRLELHTIKKGVKDSPNISVPIIEEMVGGARMGGLRAVELAAIKDPASGAYGYNVWPKLGFDRFIPPEILDEMVADQTPGVSSAVKWLRGRFQDGGNEINASDLFSIEDDIIYSQMKDLWKKHGDTLTSTAFDVEPGSKSFQVLNRYKKSLAGP